MSAVELVLSAAGTVTRTSMVVVAKSRRPIVVWLHTPFTRTVIILSETPSSEAREVFKAFAKAPSSVQLLSASMVIVVDSTA